VHFYSNNRATEKLTDPQKTLELVPIFLSLKSLRRWWRKAGANFIG
jgi:hypothetical protein